jgi:hypothetical protein
MPITICQIRRVKRMVPLEPERTFLSAYLKLPLMGRLSALEARSSAELPSKPDRQVSRRRQVLRSRRFSLLIALLCLLHCYRAPGQVPVPSVRIGPRLAIFGTITDIKPNFRNFEDYAVWGFTAGGYVQTRHVLGFELRGSVTRWGGHEHQETGLIGPRAALHVGRFSPYISVLGGEANSWSWRQPGNRKLWVEEKIAPELSILGGLDVHVGHHLSLRLGEASYSQIYRSDRTLNTLGASAGVVYHIPW